MQLAFASLTDQGGRQRNEDSLGDFSSERLFYCIVADGAGGAGHVLHLPVAGEADDVEEGEMAGNRGHAGRNTGASTGFDWQGLSSWARTTRVACLTTQLRTGRDG